MKFLKFLNNSKILSGSSSQKLPKHVIIDGCEQSPCKVKKGSDLAVDIHFTTVANTNSLKPQLSAKIFGIKMSLNVPKDQLDACEHLKNSKCPLDANQEAIYSVKLPILKSYPTMKTEIEFNLVGDNGNSHSCFKIDGQIIN